MNPMPWWAALLWFIGLTAVVTFIGVYACL